MCDFFCCRGRQSASPEPQSSFGPMTAFSSDFLQKRIFDILDLPTLKSCRLVNSSWASKSTESIQRRNCVISFYYYGGTWIKEDTKSVHEFLDKRPQFYFRCDNLNRQLADFNLDISSSPTFPCTSYVFINGNFDDPIATGFFKLQGARIKTLTLKVGEYEDRHDQIFGHYRYKHSPSQKLDVAMTLDRLLIECAPNVQNLMLYGFHDQVELIDLTSLPKQQLPNLKTFGHKFNPCLAVKAELKTAVEMIRCMDSHILERATKLDSIQNFRLSQADAVINTGKVGLVKEFRLEVYTKDTDPEVLNKFVDCEPKLYKLILTSLSQRLTREEDVKLEHVQAVARDCSKLLKSSQNSLNELTMASMGEDFVAAISFPSDGLVSLKRLTLLLFDDNNWLNSHFLLKERNEERHPRRIFPPNLHFDKSFPNLKTLCLIQPISNFSHTFFEEYFCSKGPPLGKFVTVLNLQIGVKLAVDPEDQLSDPASPVPWLIKLEELCPNVKNLEMSNFDVPMFAGGLITNEDSNDGMGWQQETLWPDLEVIVLSRVWVYPWNRGLDPVFSGIPQFLCDRKDLGLTETDIEKYFTKSLLYRRKKLKVFKIMIEDFSWWLRMCDEFDATPLLTLVGYEYGIKLRPDLRVTIGFDHTHPRARLVTEALKPVSPYINIFHIKYSCICSECRQYFDLHFDSNIGHSFDKYYYK